MKMSVLVSNKIFFREKNYKYFIGYLYNDDKVTPLHIMLPKTNVYIIISADKLNGGNLGLKVMIC